MRKILLLIGLLLSLSIVKAQKISGTIKDESSGESVIGATIVVKGTQLGATTDFDGKFEIEVSDMKPPLTLIISSVGFGTKELVVQDLSKPINFKLSSKQVDLKSITITGSRISEKQKEAPQTVESIDLIAIKQSAQNSFYEALGTLKGVDLTSASLGFTIINTRGFNSTSPVRSLQLIDGVDNQAPGLNFSLGNFLGSSELDVLKVDLIAGANSAYYGPNAFNGVIAMTTRSPFVKPGLEVSVKIGERNLVETAVRWSQVIKNKDNFERFGYKVNFFFMKAHDWEANNLAPSTDSKDGVTNAGGYDAVNRYGDEDITGANDATALAQQAQFPGLKRWYRDGYLEKDIVDYNSQNLKAGTAFHYRLKNESEIILASNFGTGTTVYQGDNRYSLKDILFFQNRLEFRKNDKFFIRAYATNEDAGKSYDAVFTALLMQNAAKNDAQWSRDYRNYWTYNHIFDRAHNLPNFPPYQYPYDVNQANAVLAEYSDTVNVWHQGARDYANNGYILSENQPFFVPGTARFDSLLNAVTSRKTFKEGGSGFYDKSALYHVQGEYKFTPKIFDITIGSNYRMYAPNSNGTIFSDTTDKPIRNHEFGFYTGIEKYFCDKKLKLNLTGRVDKNDNFNALVSPAISAVYVYKQNHVFRISFSSAIRNPTLSDQYLYYNVGRAILLGNVDGIQHLVTIPSLQAYFNTPTLDTTKLSYFNVNPVQPEKVRTAEVGYRATLLKNVFLDVNYYISMYKDFIGYKIGARIGFDPIYKNRVNSVQVYRVAANAVNEVMTQGISVGLNFYFWKYYALTGNYTYNYLDRRGSTDPLIPAFNTPTNKVNFGFNGRDIETHIFNHRIKGLGFNINFKWIEGFQYEGSPQFTGYVQSYNIVDAQVNYFMEKSKVTLKLGASNLLNNEVYQVYGGPLVGRLAYFSVLVALTK